MASQTLYDVEDRFPVGTTVSVYARPPAGAWNGSSTPPGSVVATGVVASDGSVTFSGLMETDFYLAYAGGRSVNFRVDPALSSANSGASALTPTAVKTSAYTAAASDFVPVDTTAGSVTVTLPSAPADKAQVAVKHVIQGGTNTVTIARGGSDVFNKTGGSTSITLTLLNQGVIMQYAASSGVWYVQADDLPLSGLDARFLSSTIGAGAPLTLTEGHTYFQTTAGVVVAEWVGTTGSVPVQVSDLSGTPSTAYTTARQTANDASYAQQLPAVVMPIAAGGSPIAHTAITMSQFALRLSRCIVPKTGTLHDMSVFVTLTGGNLKFVIYDCAAPRTLLYQSASIAVGSTGAWQTPVDPALAVTAGQQLEMGIIVDSATPTFGRTVQVGTITAGVQLPSAYTLGQAALPKLTSVQTQASFVPPSTIAEASITITANPLLVIGRVT